MIGSAAEWVSDEIDPAIPSVARIYDYLLGGAHNFAADREIADRLIAIQPNVVEIARQNRSFLRRAVNYMVVSGVRQFLDLGSGIPTSGNVHEIAQAVAPEARVVYVDYEQVAVAHSELLLADNDHADVVYADVTRPDEVLDASATRRLLDFDQPIGILGVTLGHYIPSTAHPVEMFARYRDAVVPGSYLVLTHLTDDFSSVHGDEIVETMKSTQDNVFPRTRAQILELFTGFDLVEPGLVTTSQWHPDGDPENMDAEPRHPEEDGLYAGVGRRV
jgi:hypothetical protein